MVLSKNISKQEFYFSFYKALNSLLGLTKKELAILSHFASIRANLSQSISDPPALDAANFNIKSRKLVASTLGISNYNLNNYLKSLRLKGIVLLTNTGKLTINPTVYPNLDSIQDTFSVEFKFTII